MALLGKTCLAGTLIACLCAVSASGDPIAHSPDSIKLISCSETVDDGASMYRYSAASPAGDGAFHVAPARDAAPTAGRDIAACCFGDECVDMDELDCRLAGGDFFNGVSCADAQFQCAGCPQDDALFAQDPTGWEFLYATFNDLDSGYNIAYERFWNVKGDICGVKWVGMTLDAGYNYCTEIPITFEVRFFEDDGGVPGPEICSYTDSIYPVVISELNSWYEYTMDFDVCCTLENGFISIAATGGDPDCLFAWISSDRGDGTHCSWVEDSRGGFWNCLEPGDAWAFDLNFCLLGTPYPGACCDEIAGTCDVVEAVDCAPASRFSPGVTCENLDPPCGALSGACCIDEAPFCYITTEDNCEGAFAGYGTTCDPTDCNGNDVYDVCDIASGYSQDCNGNGVPDECDIAAGAPDYDLNGVLDQCDPDCNGNGVPDACDISCSTGDCGNHPLGCGVSWDCQPDGVPDECELGKLGNPVLWDNDLPNHEYNMPSQFGGEYQDAMTVDDFNLPDGGVINAVEWYVEEPESFMWTGNVRLEIYADSGMKAPNDYLQQAALWIPADGGVITKTLLGEGDVYEYFYRYEITGLDITLAPGIWWIGLAPEGDMNLRGNGPAAWCSSRCGVDVVGGETHFRCPSSGNFSFKPWLQHGAFDRTDVAFKLTTTAFGADCDENGVPDECDMADCDGSPWCSDCNANGVLDGCEADCDGNGVPDECDLRDCDGSPWCSDCNGNGMIDACDINEGASSDYDADGVPDECTDCDGDGISDACELNCETGDCASNPLGCGQEDDCQPDGIPDSCQLGGAYAYHTDDGSSENNVGVSSGGYLCWLTQYVVTEDLEYIDSISLAWSYAPDLAPATVYVWSDPNGDGDPDDARVLTQAETQVLNAEEDVFNVVDLPDTPLGQAGDKFFVGVIMQHGSGYRPAPLDQTQTRQRSWLAVDPYNSIDPNNIGAAYLSPRLIDDYYPGNWLVRAQTVVVADCNGNLIPDDCDPDSDGDGIPDDCEDGCPSPGAAGSYCSADVYGDDCKVDIADLALLLSNYGMTSGATHADGDVYPAGGDGAVNLADLAALLAQYGDDCN